MTEPIDKIVSTAVRRTRSIRDLTLPKMEDNVQVKALKEYMDQKQLADPFESSYASPNPNGPHNILAPPYNFYLLMRLPQENSTLRQCIDAMTTNVDGHGHRFMYIGEEGEEDTPDALREKQTLENLFAYPNDDYSFQELRNRLRQDYETIGNAYIEVGRDRRGRVVMLSHIPAHTIRLTQRDMDETDVTVRLPRDGAKTVRVKKRFRRYVQMVGNKKVYFKEIGDPRKIDPNTGIARPDISVQSSATEIIHLSIYTPGSPYGLPRWFNQLPAVQGSRQAELTNLDFFKENAIPAALMMVSGGLLTEDSIQALEAHFSQARGRKSMNRVAVIEAGGDPSNAPENGAIPVPKMELKALVGERQGDALWSEYEKDNADKVRSSFRLPPIYIGLSTDYTYATAKTSFEVAEGQVFGPERHKFDDLINAKIVATYDPQYWSFRSQPPRIAAKEDIIAAISAFERVGALTPNVTIGLANEFFDLEIKPVLEPWGDYPFSMITTMVQTGQLEGGVFPGLEKFMIKPDAENKTQDKPKPANDSGSGDEKKVAGSGDHQLALQFLEDYIRRDL